jgi:hypothetical protein
MIITIKYKSNDDLTEYNTNEETGFSMYEESDEIDFTSDDESESI